MSVPTMEQIEAFNRLEEVKLEAILGPLCEEHGYGRMLQVVAQMWDRKDPVGSWGGKALDALPKLAQARREALEEAAKVANEIDRVAYARSWELEGLACEFEQGRAAGAREAVAAIRALADVEGT